MESEANLSSSPTSQRPWSLHCTGVDVGTLLPLHLLCCIQWLVASLFPLLYSLRPYGQSKALDSQSGVALKASTSTMYLAWISSKFLSLWCSQIKWVGATKRGIPTDWKVDIKCTVDHTLLLNILVQEKADAISPGPSFQEKQKAIFLNKFHWIFKSFFLFVF